MNVHMYIVYHILYIFWREKEIERRRDICMKNWLVSNVERNITALEKLIQNSNLILEPDKSKTILVCIARACSKQKYSIF